MSMKWSMSLSVALFCAVGSTVVLLDNCNNRHGDKVSLRLQWVHQSQFAGFYVAKEKGFYGKRGLDLTIRAGGVGFNVPLLVSTEKEDFGIWMGDQTLISAAKRKRSSNRITRSCTFSA